MVIDFKKDNEVNLFTTFKGAFDAMEPRKRLLFGVALSNMYTLLTIATPEENEWLRTVFGLYLENVVVSDENDKMVELVLSSVDKVLNNREETSSGP